MIAQLHYISQAGSNYSHLEAIQWACEAGCDWIQLRVKEQPLEVITTIATEARVICNQSNAKLIINDYPEVAKVVKADGVHLGLLDQPHVEARTLLGSDFIIGGTANTINDIRNYAEQGVVDYIGVGPFRFTTTKKNLSPILGLAGYQKIVAQCKAEGIDLPLIAIGGIQLADIPDILATGVHGIATSTLITKAANRKPVVKQIRTWMSEVA